MSDLADFLLARIAEDEAAAQEAPTRGALIWAADDRGWVSPPWSQDRLLAECEAKRRIVDECRHQRVEFDRRDTADDWPDQTAALMGDAILGLLALPYGDHPDYREEWRP